MNKLQSLNSLNILSTRWIDRLSYSRDASVYRMVPEAVARPRNNKEIEILFTEQEDFSVLLT